MYLPLARSASKLARAFSSSPTLAGVPFLQTDPTSLTGFCARAGPVLISKPKENIVRRTGFIFPPQVERRGPKERGEHYHLRIYSSTENGLLCAPHSLLLANDMMPD